MDCKAINDKTKKKLDALAEKIKTDNGMKISEVRKYLRKYKSTLVTLTNNYLIYEEERPGQRKGRTATFICIY